MPRKQAFVSTAIVALAIPAGWLHGPAPALGQPSTSAVSQPPAPVVAQTVPQSSPGDAADDSAAAEARRTGRRVEVTQAATGSSQTFVNPDGHHTLVQYAAPTRVAKNGGWAPIDRTLRFQRDGSVSPGAVVSDLRLSGGGDNRLVTLGKAARQLRMGWSGTLPKPTLAADTATYREVLPGVDLRIRAETDGFSEVLVVKTKAAAQNPALAQIHFPMSATGLKLTTKPDGTVIASDPAGKVVFSSGQAVMWDTPPTAGTTAAKQVNQRHAAIPTALAGGDLVIRPDRNLLAAASFPVFIDPSWSSSAGDMWTHINNRDDRTRETSYWDFDREEGAKVGWAYDDSGNIYRSLFRMGLGSIAGARVLKAKFTITLDYTPSSTSTYADLWTTSPIDRSAKVTWNNTQWFEYMAGAEAAAYNTPDVSMGFSSVKLKTVVQQLADQRAATITLGLRAPDEDAEHRKEWKKFRGETAAIVVDYNNAPRVPLKVNFTTPKACGTAAAPTLIGTDHPAFAAIASDPDNDTMVSKLSVFRAVGNGLQYSVDSSLTSSGAAFGWPELPAGTLSDGVTYYYTAKSDDQVVDDGIDFGAASSPCYFTVDSDAPGQPTIDSTDFPLSGPAVPARTIGIVNLRPAAGDTDVAEYLYGSAKDKVSQVIEAGPDGTAALPVTVWPDPVTHIPTRPLYVKAVDKAGNRSAATPLRTLRASSGSTPPTARNDVNGDGRTDVSFVLDQGFGRTGVWNLLAKAGGLTTGTMAWDSGDNGGFALSKTSAVQGDFDGDGKADVALFRDEPGGIVGLYLLKSDGNKYDPPALIWRSAPKAWTIATAHLFAGEVTGDTKTDIVAQINTGSGNWKALVFPGTNLAAPTQWLQTASGSGDWAKSQPVAADVDGDGKSDLVSLKDLGACRTVAEVFKSTGTTFGGASTWYDGNYCWDKSNVVPGDVDGDGKEDLVAIYDNGSQNTALKVFRSTGTALSMSQWWQDSARFDPLKASLTVGDYSKDGKADAALVYSLDGGGREVYLLNSTGTAFDPPVSGWKETRVGASLSPKYDIEPRTYELVARNSGRCLEVAGASQAKPADIQQWDCFGGLHQRFRIVPVAGTEQFEVHAVHVNIAPAPADGKARCFDVTNQSIADNEKVIEWSCLGTANQQMLLEYVEGSSYDTVLRLRFAHSSKCAAIAGAATGNGAKLIQSPCSTASNQQFTLRAALNTPQLDGRYKVSTYQGGHVLDIKDCNPDSGVRMWDWVQGSPCQSWQFKPLGDDIYQIIDPSTGTAIQVGGCSRADGAPVIALQVDASDCQRWRVEPAGEGWSIHQVDTGKSLDVGACKDTVPAIVDVWPYWNGPCQRWKLEKVG